jgi:hypothetical protein
VGPTQPPKQYVPGLSSEGKPTGTWRWPPPSSAEVKERVDPYIYSTSGPSWSLLWRTLPFTPCCWKPMGLENWNCVSLEILTALWKKTPFLRDMTPCHRIVIISRCFEEHSAFILKFREETVSQSETSATGLPTDAADYPRLTESSK